MISLADRITQSELMDDPDIGFFEFQRTLHEIEKINRVTGAYRATLAAIGYLSQRSIKNQPLRILDIGFGNGDLLRCIERWAKRNNVPVRLTGVDLNPWAEHAARLASPASSEIEYVTCDVFHFVPTKPFHIIINSLFTHHLSNEEISRVLDWMTQQSLYGWVINDLHRHYVPYYFIKAYVYALGFSKLVRNDAPLSVARSFKRYDWQQLTQQANLPENRVQITWHWPFRYRVLYATA